MWLSNRGYDYSYLNVTDHAAMINELQRLGNRKAVLVITNNKGYRKPGNQRHPHSWSIAIKNKWSIGFYLKSDNCYAGHLADATRTSAIAEIPEAVTQL